VCGWNCKFSRQEGNSFNDVTQCFSVHPSSQMLDSLCCCCIILVYVLLQSYRECRAACRNALLLCGQVYWSLLYSAAATSAPSLSKSFPRSADIMESMENSCFSSFRFFSLRRCLCYLFSTLSVIITNDKMVVSSTSTVVNVLCYKSGGRWFDPSWCHWNFSLTYKVIQIWPGLSN